MKRDKLGRFAKESNPEVIVSVILDKSGSMDFIRQATISGFNEYLGTLKSKEQNIKFNLTLFDTESIEKRYINTPLRQVSKLSMENYIPNAGTPLYDAVVDSVEMLFETVKNKKTRPSVVVVIMTDGQENSSQKHDQKCMRDLIKKLQKEYNWTFIYMGANQDSYANATNYGISKGNTVNWGYSDKGSRAAFVGMAMGTMAYSANVMNTGGGGGAGYKTDAFFSKALKSKIEQEVK